MCDLVGPILEIIKFIGRPAKRYLTYQRKFNAYVDHFKQAQADLHAREADVRRQLQDEHRFGKLPKKEVERWFEKVQETIVRAQGVEVKIHKGKYLLRSCLGILVDETVQIMKGVYAEGQFPDGLVLNDSSIVAAELPTPELTGDTDVTEEIYMYLMGDEVRMIGVCGMGGIGKTTIMKNVHNRLLKEDKFSKLIWTTVSQDFDIQRLQNQIVSQLKEKLSDDEDTARRAAKLSQILRKQGSHVLILDDVWRSFSLEDVGIPEPNVDNGCKLVLTTRSAEVVRSMGCKKVQVPCLSMEEAVQLFSSKVGLDMLLNPSLEQIMKLVVGECGGLPLAIVTVAGCMRGISDHVAWEDALNELRGYIRSIQDMEDKVFVCIKFSYDRLKQKDQDCFLYCALFPEDYEIEKEEIIEYWMEEGLIDDLGTRQAIQGSGHSILRKLEENCLLERAKEDRHIKMHDVVRDMALHITRKRFLVKSGKQLRELPENDEWGEDLEKVSLMRNNMSKIPQNMLSPNCHKLTTLLLSDSSLKEIPETFFDHMPNLKILDLSENYYLTKLPNSISNLENLTTLLLRFCALEGVPSLSKLQAMKKLDLERSSIKEIPHGLEMLVNLRYLNLGFTKELKEIPDGILLKFNHLQHLIIHPALSRAEEMKTLDKLEVLDVCITADEDLSMYACRRKEINKYSILVRTIDDLYGMYVNKGDCGKIVQFDGVNLKTEYQIILLPSDIQILVIRRVDVIEGRTSSLNNMFELKDINHLKRCLISTCTGLESVFSSWCASLQTLEVLRLYYMDNLEVIVGESVPQTPGIFSSLKVIALYDCSLKFVLSAKWDLHNLEELEVESCKEMEEIIASEEEKEGMSTHNKVKITLPKLRILTLSYLPNLKSICHPNETLVCDSLQEIEIRDCPELKRIPLYLPLLELSSSQPSAPPSLEEIRICPKESLESMEWDHPNAKNVLLPLLKYTDESTWGWVQIQAVGNKLM